MAAGLPRKLEWKNILRPIRSLSESALNLQRNGMDRVLLNLMSASELKDAIEYLKMKVNDSKMINGYSHKRTIEIKDRLDLYMRRYSQIIMDEIKKVQGY
jgi:hypothetical protein